MERKKDRSQEKETKKINRNQLKSGKDRALFNLKLHRYGF